MNSDTGISWAGLLMIVVGTWLILRTVHSDSTGRTLPDHILGTNGSNRAGDALGALLVADVAAKSLPGIGSGGNNTTAGGSASEDEGDAATEDEGGTSLLDLLFGAG